MPPSFPLPKQLQRESEAAKTPSASASVISGSSSAIVRDATTAEKTDGGGGVKFEEKDEEEDVVRGDEGKRCRLSSSFLLHALHSVTVSRIGLAVFDLLQVLLQELL